jgi:tetratricopeptide (TPR) repeat protein
LGLHFIGIIGHNIIEIKSTITGKIIIMKKEFLLAGLILASFITNAQNKKQSSGAITGLDSKTFLKSSSNQACKCVDSISVENKTKGEVAKLISDCIDKQVVTYQMEDKLFANMDVNKEIEKALSGDTLKKKSKTPKTTEVQINTNQKSDDYKKYYYQLERYMMDSCASLRVAINANDKQNKNSLSENPAALALYDAGLKDVEKENYQQAVLDFESALKIDPLFAFAWDNLGISYRHLDNYDKAIQAYNSSLKIDPNGITPLQNIAVAYQFKKQYDKSIEAYEKLEKLDKDNPEVYYGIGRVYAVYLQDYEKGLDNLCKAYNLYDEQKSPFRTDAESLIAGIYQEMKKQGREKKFKEILKANHINPE